MKVGGCERPLHRNREPRQAGDVLKGAQRGEFLTEEGLISRLSVSGADLRFVDPPERLGESERAGKLRVVEILLGIAIRTAAVGIDTGREQQTLAQRQEFFLGEQAEVLDPLPLLEHPHVGPGPNDSEAANEVATHDAGDAEIAAGAVYSGGGGRPEGATERSECEHSVRSEMEVHVVAIAEESSAGLAVICRLELELGRKEKRVLLRELIGSAVDGELEAERLPLDRVEGEPARQNRSQHLLVVLHQRRCLQRIARHERIRWIGPVWIPLQVHEARREREYHPQAHAGVVVVGETALGERLQCLGLEAEVEAIPEILIEVRADRLLAVAGIVDDSAVLLPKAGREIAGV